MKLFIPLYLMAFIVIAMTRSATGILDEADFPEEADSRDDLRDDVDGRMLWWHWPTQPPPPPPRQPTWDLTCNNVNSLNDMRSWLQWYFRSGYCGDGWDFGKTKNCGLNPGLWCATGSGWSILSNGQIKCCKAPRNRCQRKLNNFCYGGGNIIVRTSGNPRQLARC